MTIQNYFKKILIRQKEIGYSFPNSLNPSASKQQIDEFEKLFGFKLSKEVKDLYFFANGSQTNTSSDIDNCIIPLHRFLSLTDAMKYYNDNIKNENVFDELFENWNSKIKPGRHLFPFIADDIHCYWVDLNDKSENYGKLYSAINNGQSPNYEFISLKIFFKTILECYNNDIFYLDTEYKFLSVDYVRYVEMCQRFNPDIEYWETISKDLQKNKSCC